jgi:translation initiation factor IF-2
VTEVKKASKEVGEEKRKEKRLYVLREKKLKRNANEEVLKQQQVVKARAVIAGPVQVGKIDLNQRSCSPVNSNSEVPPSLLKWKHQAKTSTEKPVVKEKVQEKVVDKKEVKAVIETKEPVKEPVKRKRSVSEEKQLKAEETCGG